MTGVKIRGISYKATLVLYATRRGERVFGKGSQNLLAGKGVEKVRTCGLRIR